MKMRNIFLKIVIIFSILQLLIYPMFLLPKVEAVDWGEVFTSADSWLKKGIDSKDRTEKDEKTGVEQRVYPDNVSVEDINKANSTIFHTLLTAAVAIAVIVGGILGIKFMLASVEDKAKIKEAFIPYVLGCIVAFGAIGIWGIFVNILNDI